MVEIEVKDSARFIRRHMNKALRRSYLKALTEPITNSDDTYRRVDKACLESRAELPIAQKSIIVYVSPKRKQFDIADLGEGISHDEMIEYFREYGEEKRTHAMGGRGVFGQGLSDVLFSREGGGWVHSIKDGAYSHAQFKWKKKKEGGVLRERRVIRVPEPSRADRKIREQLRIPEGNGTVVSFKFNEAPFPSKEELTQRLSQFHMLRLINSDSHRRVIICYTDEDTQSDQVHYEFPQGVFLGRLSTAMKYDGADISIEAELYRSDDPLLQGEGGEDRQGGLLVSDEEQSVLDLTLFGYDDDPLAVHFWGKLRLIGAHKLIRKKLQEQDEMLTETRDGFARGHGFYVKLRQIIDDWLRPFIEAERDRTSQKVSALTEETQREHKKAFQMLNELFREVNSDIIALPPGTSLNGEVERPQNGMEFSSDRVTLKKGIKYSVQLLIDARTILPGSRIRLRSLSPNLKLGPRLIYVAPLATLPDDEIDRHRIVLSCDTPGVEAKVVASTKGHRAELTVSVIESPPKDDTIKTISLQQPMEFRPNVVRRKPGVSGILHLFVDTDQIPKNGSISLACTNDRIRLQNTKVSPTTGIQLSEKVSKINVTFIGYSEGQTGTVTATYGNIQATAAIKITTLEGLGDLFVDWDYRPVQAVFQAYFEKETGLVVLNSNHPVNRQYLGTDKPEAHRAVEAFSHCQMLLATMILEVCLWYTYSEAHRNNRIELRDPNNPWIDIQRYIEESKFKLGKDFLSKFLRQPISRLPLSDPSVELPHLATQ